MLNFATGNTWCEACEVFLPHDPDLRGTSLPSPARCEDYGIPNMPTHCRWEACTRGELASIVGPPPDVDLRLDAATCASCGPGYVSDLNGNCVSCDETSREHRVGNACAPCDDGFVVTPDGESCVECASTAITTPNSGNSCEPCPFPQHANRATNMCEECPPDAIVDVATFQAGGHCGEPFIDINPDGGGGDLCPDEFWIEVRNVDLLATGTPSELRFDSFAFSNAEFCGLDFVSLHQDYVRQQSSGTEIESAVDSLYGSDCADYQGGACPDACIFNLFGFQTFSAQDIATTGLTTLRVRLHDLPSQTSRIDIVVAASDLCAGPG